jgi:hypothetical protein
LLRCSLVILIAVYRLPRAIFQCCAVSCSFALECLGQSRDQRKRLSHALRLCISNDLVNRNCRTYVIAGQDRRQPGGEGNAGRLAWFLGVGDGELSSPFGYIISFLNLVSCAQLLDIEVRFAGCQRWSVLVHLGPVCTIASYEGCQGSMCLPGDNIYRSRRIYASQINGAGPFSHWSIMWARRSRIGYFDDSPPAEKAI